MNVAHSRQVVRMQTLRTFKVKTGKNVKKNASFVFSHGFHKHMEFGKSMIVMLLFKFALKICDTALLFWNILDNFCQNTSLAI